MPLRIWDSIIPFLPCRIWDSIRSFLERRTWNSVRLILPHRIVGKRGNTVVSGTELRKQFFFFNEYSRETQTWLLTCSLTVSVQILMSPNLKFSLVPSVPKKHVIAASRRFPFPSVPRYLLGCLPSQSFVYQHLCPLYVSASPRAISCFFQSCSW